ncbi:MAG: hypothetical protein JSS51_14810 [Planctomycetes bacterium]|nr:hypothetical protein [Planctomycetota bacterium]
MTATLTEPTRFEEDCRRSVQALQSALLELYRAVGADPARPQDVSRQFNLNKNLTWKVARIIAASDGYEAIPLIPGPGGLEILLSAMGKGEAPADKLERVRTAAKEFDRMVEVHTGDRNTLELVLDSAGGGRPMEMSRRLAFRGNSGIWGIQAGVRVTTYFMAPNRHDPAMLDLATLAGLTRIRRLRPVERWPVFQVREYNDDGSATGRRRRESLERHEGVSSHPWILGSLCSGALPTMHLTQRGDTTIYELGEGPVGRTGECSCFFGFTDTAEVPRYRDASNTVGEFVSSVSIPAEALLFDLFIHRDLTEAMKPSTEMLGTIGGSVEGAGVLRLPLPESIRDMGMGASVDSLLVDRYGEGVNAVFDRLERNPRDFRCLRLLVEYPPMSSRAIIRYELPARP